MNISCALMRGDIGSWHHRADYILNKCDGTCHDLSENAGRHLDLVVSCCFRVPSVSQISIAQPFVTRCRPCLRDARLCDQTTATWELNWTFPRWYKITISICGWQLGRKLAGRAKGEGGRCDEREVCEELGDTKWRVSLIWRPCPQEWSSHRKTAVKSQPGG